MFKLFLSSVLAVFITPTAFAFSFSSLFFPKHHAQHAISSLEKQIQSAGYTNFSGKWQGTCSIQSESDPLVIDLEIYNDETMLTVGDHDGDVSFEIGGASSHARSSRWLHDFSFETVSWSQDKTSLMLHGRDLETSGTDGHLYTYLYMLSLSLENDQLRMAYDSRYFNDLVQYDESHNTCILSRVDINQTK